MRESCVVRWPHEPGWTWLVFLLPSSCLGLCPVLGGWRDIFHRSPVVTDVTDVPKVYCYVCPLVISVAIYCTRKDAWQRLESSVFSWFDESMISMPSSFLLNLRVLAITIVLGSIVGLYCLYRAGSLAVVFRMQKVVVSERAFRVWGPTFMPSTFRPISVSWVRTESTISCVARSQQAFLFHHFHLVDRCTKESILQEDLQCGRSSSLLQQSWPLVLVCQWAAGVSGNDKKKVVFHVCRRVLWLLQPPRLQLRAQHARHLWCAVAECIRGGESSDHAWSRADGCWKSTIRGWCKHQLQFGQWL